MPANALLEVCVDAVGSALAAAAGGADRLELCSSLSEGGVTPSAGMLSTVRTLVQIPIYVLIRPRRGDFLYSHQELEVMKKDISMARELGANGIVLGALLPDGTIDVKTTEQLIDFAQPLPVTFHRAFDLCPDPFKALEALIALKATRVLTSGQQRTAPEGSPLIAKLIQKAGDQIIILPGGGINEDNIYQLKQSTGALEFHASARIKRNSPMQYQKLAVTMSGGASLSEYEIAETSEEKVKAIKGNLL